MLSFETVFEFLKAFESGVDEAEHRIYHIKIAYEVSYEVENFLFNLLCMRLIESGRLFRRRSKDLFFIEIMAPKFKGIFNCYFLLIFIYRLSIRNLDNWE